MDTGTGTTAADRTFQAPPGAENNDDSHFLSEMPPFAITWPERRMCHTIQKTVEKLTNHPLEMHFQV